MVAEEGAKREVMMMMMMMVRYDGLEMIRYHLKESLRVSFRCRDQNVPSETQPAEKKKIKN